jgi:molybdopterin synthase catalytic subunit
MSDTICIQSEPFDLADEVTALSVGAGAVATFTGHVRADDGVEALIVEHYPGMTEREIARHIEEARRRWHVLAVTVIHRVGELKQGEAIVLVAVSAAHRGDAFRACEFLMDHLKTTATFWKQERRAGALTWVEARASDHHAAKKW